MNDLFKNKQGRESPCKSMHCFNDPHFHKSKDHSVTNSKHQKEKTINIIGLGFTCIANSCVIIPPSYPSMLEVYFGIGYVLAYGKTGQHMEPYILQSLTACCHRQALMGIIVNNILLKQDYHLVNMYFRICVLLSSANIRPCDFTKDPLLQTEI